MKLEQKLLALGFEKNSIISSSQYYNKALDLYVYVSFNKIQIIQLSKIWHTDFKTIYYKKYLKELNRTLKKLNKLL